MFLPCRASRCLLLHGCNCVAKLYRAEDWQNAATVLPPQVRNRIFETVFSTNERGNGFAVVQQIITESDA
jgi:hypothetical protein